MDGTNDPLQRNGGPAIYNQYGNVDYDSAGGYTWLTYSERLQKAGISWQIYQNMDDNFTDNSVAGFRSFRASYFGEPEADPALARRGLLTRDLRRDGAEHLGVAPRRRGRPHLRLQLAGHLERAATPSATPPWAAARAASTRNGQLSPLEGM